jgi:glycosyltransferase involved in cell wall biosynthesis
VSARAALRLLIVTAWPLDTPGGVQTLVRRLADELAREERVRVEVVTGLMPGEATLPVPPPAHRGHRVPLRTRPRPSWMPPDHEIVGRAWLAGLEAIAAAFAPHVLLCVAHHSAEAHQAGALARARRIPLVLWPLVHADDPRHVNETARRLYGSARLVVCASDGERRWLTEAAGLAPARTLLLEGGSWAAALPLRGRGAPAPGAVVELLSVGEFAPHKRLADQVEALARLRARGMPARLTLAGAARRARAVEQLAEAACARGLDGAVRLLPAPPDDALAALYASAHYFLFTSASESFGLALLDAICAGVFPVVYPHPAYGGLVAASGFGRVTPRADPVALADAVRQAVAAAEPGRSPGAGWRAAHTWPRVAASLLARLEGLLR